VQADNQGAKIMTNAATQQADDLRTAELRAMCAALSAKNTMTADEAIQAAAEVTADRQAQERRIVNGMLCRLGADI
jgi:phage I-like protein